MRDVNSFIRDQVRKILLEENDGTSESPEQKKKEPPQQGPRVLRGRVGKGNFNKATRLAGSLAEENPAELVTKLGLKGASGGTDIEKVRSIIDQARQGASVMRTAYIKTEIMKDESNTELVRIGHSSEISPRDAAQYIFLTFIAAEKEGLLGGIQGKIVPGLVTLSGKEEVAVLLQK